MVTTESGLQYKDIKVGGGPSPPIGFQVYFCFCFSNDLYYPHSQPPTKGGEKVKGKKEKRSQGKSLTPKFRLT